MIGRQMGAFLLGVGVMVTYGALRDAGLWGEVGDEYTDDYNTEQKERPEKKQTYGEYVSERLKIERVMRYGWLGKWF